MRDIVFALTERQVSWGGMSVFGFVPGSRLVGLGTLIALQTLFAMPAESQVLKGLALVIGQSDYASLPDLANTGRDAEAI